MRVGRREVRLTNLDKVFFPEPGLTKGDLIQYYVDVADCVLHHVRRRPMQMKRYPDGVDGFFFYQKRVPEPHPDWLDTSTSGSRAGAAPTSRSSRTPPGWPGSRTSAASSCTRGTRGSTTSSGPTTC